MSIRNALLAPLFVAGALFLGNALAQETAAVTATTGTVVVQKRDGALRSVAPGSKVEVGDVVITQPNSTAQLKFTDGGDLSIAGNSQLRVDAYAFDKARPREDSLAISLLKGGLRAITGLVGKRGDREAYKVQTGTATIGIRGTEFIAALCDEDCLKEAASARVVRATDSEIVARVALLVGAATAIDKPGTSRALQVGSPLYEGNIIETRAGGHVVLLFSDESRVTLQPETRFAVERFRYAAARPEEGSAALRLLKGGMRALTGLIGKKHPQGYQVHTTTATIGIRGTGFDALCSGVCESDASSRQPGAKPGPFGGLLVNAWQDTVIVRNAAGSFTVVEGQTVHVASESDPPAYLDAVPDVMRDAPGPRPDDIRIDFEQLFGQPQVPGIGLYVLVKDGVIVLAQGERVLELQRGESAYAGFAPGDLYRLPAPPPVLQFFETQLPPLAPPGSLICTF